MDSLDPILLVRLCVLLTVLTVALGSAFRRYRRENRRLKALLPDDWQAVEAAQELGPDGLATRAILLVSQEQQLRELEERLNAKEESLAPREESLTTRETHLDTIARRLSEQTEHLKNDSDRLESKWAQLAAKSAGLQRAQSKFDSERLELDRFIANLRSEYAQKPISEWFEEAHAGIYRNEIEVETKFVYPMLRNLGYKNENLEVRYPISIQVGRNTNRGEADWVVWNAREGTPGRKVLFVVEAKAPSQALTTEVIYQTRSYAFALNAPNYVCTNGRQILIFRRGVQEDICALDCTAKELPQYWEAIQDLIGNDG